MIEKICQKHIYYFLLFFMGVAFYVMNVLTPMGGDDYAYCFFYDDHSILLRPTSERVTSFPMALESMWNHNHIVNGRFVSHLVLQCIDALCGKWVFNILNTLFFVSILHILSIFSGIRYSAPVLCISFLASMCVFPYPGQTMLWMTGSINYMWTTTIALIYVYWVERKTPKNVKWYIHIILIFGGLFAGWTNESITAPVALGLFIYYLTHRDKFKGSAVSLYFGYAVGAALIIFGPGTFSRIVNEKDVVIPSVSATQFLFSHTYALISGFFTGILPIIVLCYYLFRVLKDYRVRLLTIFRSLHGALFFSFTLFLFALGMFNAERAFYGVTAFCFIIIMRLCGNWISRCNFKGALVLIFLCCLPAYHAYCGIIQYHDVDRFFCEKILASPFQCVIESPVPPSQNRYCYYGGMETLGTDRYNYHNRVKAFYYGKEYIQALPKVVYDAWKRDSLDLLKDFNVIPVTKDQMVPHRISAIYHYEPSEELLAIHQRVIRYLLNSTEMLEQKKDVYYVSKGSGNWLLVPKDDRAIKIEIPMMSNEEEIFLPILNLK